MYGNGIGWGWMVLMQLVWIVLFGLVVWAVLRLAPLGPGRDAGTVAARRESAREVLDRRYAAGEIDEDEYRRIRGDLDGGGEP
jgi:putative membrane protein